jgi:hypothetical protein
MLLDSEFSSQHMKLSSEFNKAIVDARFHYRDQALRAQPIYHALSSTKVVSNISLEYKDPSQ